MGVWSWLQPIVELDIRLLAHNPQCQLYYYYCYETVLGPAHPAWKESHHRAKWEWWSPRLCHVLGRELVNTEDLISSSVSPLVTPEPCPTSATIGLPNSLLQMKPALMHSSQLEVRNGDSQHSDEGCDSRCDHRRVLRPSTHQMSGNAELSTRSFLSGLNTLSSWIGFARCSCWCLAPELSSQFPSMIRWLLVRQLAITVLLRVWAYIKRLALDMRH